MNPALERGFSFSASTTMMTRNQPLATVCYRLGLQDASPRPLSAALPPKRGGRRRTSLEGGNRGEYRGGWSELHSYGDLNRPQCGLKTQTCRPWRPVGRSGGACPSQNARTGDRGQSKNRQFDTMRSAPPGFAQLLRINGALA